MKAPKTTTEKLKAVLNSVLMSENLKGLKKRGVKDVQVITRKQFMEALETLVATAEPAESIAQKSSTQRRIELLLMEQERLRRDKSELEHQKGLVENDRAELSGRLEEIVNAGSKAVGEKITVDDVRQWLREREAFRDQAEDLKRQSESARESYEEEITNLRVTQSSLEGERDGLGEQLASAQHEIERLRSDLEASRTLAANNKRRNLELENQVAELKAQLDIAQSTIADKDLALAAKDKEIDELKNPPEPEAEAEVEAQSPEATRRLPGRSGARPATRRLNRGTPSSGARGKPRGRDSTAYNFSFGAGSNGGSSGRTSRAGRRRRRLS